MESSVPGLVVLLGSGETLPSSGATHEYVAQRLPTQPRIAILETPAGFELNSERVAGRIQKFLAGRLQNYAPRIDVIAARRRGTPFSPDAPEVVAPLLQADEILLGPGSPTYTARQLRDSLALHYIRARHRLGATLFLASAATLAFGSLTLPVYEIYKVGEDLHWKEGLRFFEAFGWPLVIVPHWNNQDGGAELDTSRCFVGRPRFEALAEQLPAEISVVGIDEHTALVMDFSAESCLIFGRGGVTIHRAGASQTSAAGARLPFATLGNFRRPAPEEGIPPAIWQQAVAAQIERNSQAAQRPQPGPDILALVAQRDADRAAGRWAEADALRQAVEALGWRIQDTGNGPQLEPSGWG